MTAPSGTLVRSFTDPLHEVVSPIDASTYAFIHLADPNNVMGNDSFLKTAYKNKEVKELAVALAKSGYYIYRVVDNVARFVHEEHIPTLWHLVKDGTYKKSADGLIYSLEEPAAGGRAQNIVVVFSSISGDIFANSLSRYFTQNYKSLPKYLPDDTAILRIADIGGMVGSFYLDTQYAPKNTQRIARLIESVRTEMGIEKDSVITYGASKGATGALFHAVENGYKCVSVEPIVNDHYYETAYRDSHFTADKIFIDKKEVTFANLLDRHSRGNGTDSANGEGNIVVIYSDQSPQTPYIKHILGERPSPTISLVNFRHPLITDHPDVSPHSLNLVSMYLNMMCYKLPIISGQLTLHCEASST